MAEPPHPGPGVFIVACPNGPLLVRGDFVLLDEEGRQIDRHRKTIALCRCGASAIKPYCDGTHKLNGFRTTPPGEDAGELEPGEEKLH